LSKTVEGQIMWPEEQGQHEKKRALRGVCIKAAFRVVGTRKKREERPQKRCEAGGWGAVTARTMGGVCECKTSGILDLGGQKREDPAKEILEAERPSFAWEKSGVEERG